MKSVGKKKKQTGNTSTLLELTHMGRLTVNRTYQMKESCGRSGVMATVGQGD